MTRAAIYARFSSDRQRETSIDAQLSECRRLCKSRRWTVVAEYIDRAKSASTTDRAEFKRMMVDAQAGAFDVIVSHKLDRMSRSITDVLLMMRDLETWHKQYLSVAEQLDFTTPIGRMFLVIFAWFAEWYLINLRGEIEKGMRTRNEGGMPTGSFPPFGYTRTPGKPDEPNEHAPHVLWGFEQYATARVSYRQIAEEFNKRGLVTTKGGPWNVENVREMIRNAFYAGWVTRRGCTDEHTASGQRKRVPRSKAKLYPGKHKPIVSQELFDRCQAVRAKRWSTTQGRKEKRTDYLLGGIAYCSGCGRKLTANCRDDGTGERYICTSRRLNLECVAEHKVALQSRLTAQVDAKIASIAIPRAIERRAVEIHNAPRAKLNTDKRRARLEAERERTIKLFQRGLIDEARLDGEMARIKADLDDLIVPVDVPAAIEQLHHMTELWQGASPAQRALFMRTIFEKVVVDVDRCEIVDWEVRKDFAGLIP